MDFESSNFEDVEYNSVSPINGINTELLPFQSITSLVYKTKINNKWLLLKRLKPEYKELPQYVEAIEKEFSIGFNLDHPHIVKYLNKGKDSDGIYLIAEFVDGLSLRELLQKNTNGINDKLLLSKIFSQLLDALEYLHRQQIYHLDLKPENILITHKGDNVKIIDFGLSRTDSYISTASGTKKYCAPEQIQQPNDADARSDIYSLGLILLELLTGNTDISGLKHISKRYRKIISKCIESDQKRRFSSIDQIKILFLQKSFPVNWLFVSIISLLVFGVLGLKLLSPLFNIQTTNSQINTNSINQNQSSQINNIIAVEMGNSKKSLDSIFQENKAKQNRTIALKDSIFCCKMGLKNYTDFLDSMKILNTKPEWRNQLVLKTNWSNEITRNNFDSLSSYLSSRYKNNEFAKHKLIMLYKRHSEISEKRMDSIVWNNKVRH